MHIKISESVPYNKNDQEEENMAKSDQMHASKTLTDSWEHAWHLWKRERQSTTLNWKYILENCFPWKLFWTINLTLDSNPNPGTPSWMVTRKQHGPSLWWVMFWGGQHADLTLRFKTNTRIFSFHAFSYPTVFGSRTEKDRLSLHYYLYF